MHDRNLCKECNIITVGSNHKTNHEKTTYGKNRVTKLSHPQTEAPALNKKRWVQPKQNVNNRKVEKNYSLKLIK